MNRSLGGCVVLLVMLLAGCVKKAPPLQSIEPGTLKAVAALDHWQIQGALAIKAPQQAVNVRFRWLQCQNGYEMRLLSPLGTSVALIRKTATGVELLRGQQKLHGKDAQTLLRQVLKIPLPLDEFVFWVRGLPKPDTAVTDLLNGPDQRGFTQQGWQLQMDQQSQVQDAQLGALILPRLIEFTNTSLALTGKMVINAWQTETTLACQQQP